MKKEEFEDIAPYDDSIFPEKIAELTADPAFEYAVKYVLPDMDYAELAKNLSEVKGKEELQLKIMHPFLELLASRYTSELTCNGLHGLSNDSPRIFITNHRDIVLDPAFLNLCFIRAGLRTSEIAIGNNLLIYAWIEDLVRLNKSFIVYRNIKAPREALEAACHLSAYLHYCIERKKQSVWIAQREGRSKDSSDHTQESLIKMMTLAGEGTPLERLTALNLTPTAISYEYDPNDYLKAREFLLKSKDPDFSKSQRDDLKSMETGLLGQKGRVNFSIGDSISSQLKEKLPTDAPRSQVLKLACTLIDKTIHSGYHIYPVNYIAFDRLEGNSRWHDFYSVDEAKAADDYWDSQLAKVEDKSKFSEDDRLFMLRKMWTMYAYPLKNKLEASSLS